MAESVLRRFHPGKSEALCVGESALDSKAVWLTITERSGEQAGRLHSVFYDDELNVRSEGYLRIIWYPEFQYRNFFQQSLTGSTPKQAQRHYIYENIIKRRGNGHREIPRQAKRPISSDIADSTDHICQGHIGGIGRRSLVNHCTGENKSQESPRKRLRTSATAPTDVNVHDSRDAILPSPPSTDPANTQLHGSFTKASLNAQSDDSCTSSSPPAEALSPYMSKRTHFRVSASDRPSRAPAYVPMDRCASLRQFFQILAMACNITEQATFSEVSVEYTWKKDEHHLIRRDWPMDWKIFIDTLRKAWRKECHLFGEDGCKVKMLAHVST